MAKRRNRGRSRLAKRRRSHTNDGARLRLALHPILALRHTGAFDDEVRHGFELRLRDGPRLASDDPLLGAFGVRVGELEGFDEYDAPTQHEGLNPGKELSFRNEFDDDGVETVAVWDFDGARRAGTLTHEHAAYVRAGGAFGSVYSVFSLQERRSSPDDRRCGLTIVVFPRRTASLDIKAAGSYHRPVQRQRPRLVLVADAVSEIRLWDNDAITAPAALDELPLSPQLIHEFGELQTALVRAANDTETTADVHEREGLELERCRLDARAEHLWRRARAELAREYVVGFVGHGMDRPIWSPASARDEDDAWDDEYD